MTLYVLLLVEYGDMYINVCVAHEPITALKKEIKKNSLKAEVTDRQWAIAIVCK